MFKSSIGGWNHHLPNEFYDDIIAVMTMIRAKSKINGEAIFYLVKKGGQLRIVRCRPVLVLRRLNS